MASTINLPLHRQLQLHPSLYCLMATDEQAATMLHLVADAIEHEGLSGQAAEWLRWQARAAFGVKPATEPERRSAIDIPTPPPPPPLRDAG